MQDATGGRRLAVGQGGSAEDSLQDVDGGREWTEGSQQPFEGYLYVSSGCGRLACAATLITINVDPLRLYS